MRRSYWTVRILRLFERDLGSFLGFGSAWACRVRLKLNLMSGRPLRCSWSSNRPAGPNNYILYNTHFMLAAAIYFWFRGAQRNEGQDPRAQGFDQPFTWLTKIINILLLLCMIFAIKGGFFWDIPFHEKKSQSRIFFSFQTLLQLLYKCRYSADTV